MTIELSSISKSYGATQVLKSISLHIQEGEFVVILGESGCGKSTLLKIIAGLDEPTSGELRIASRLMNGVQPRKRGLAMVFQSYALYPHLTVAENISFPIKMMRWRYWYSLPLIGRLFPGRRQVAAAMEEAAREAAAKVRLSHLLDRKPRELSGGQRQRVALARAIVDGRKVCLMDEPLSNLDAQLRASTRREISDLHGEFGHTIVYVTHDQVEAMTMGTRVILMRDGRIEQDGTPAEIYENPKTVYAAEFLGSPRINLIRVEQSSWAAHSGGPTLHIGADGISPAAQGDRLVGIRPDHVEFVPADEGDYVFLSAEYLGGKSIVSLKHLTDGSVVQGYGAEAFDRTRRYFLRFSRDHVLYFDHASGRRIYE